MKSRDRIPGGLADRSKPSDFDQEELRMGIAVEREHTTDRKVAREIAMDHLKEDPRYYTKLKKIHKESKKLSDIQRAIAATRHAQKHDTPEAHGDAQKHWKEMADKSTAGWLKKHYDDIGKHHFNRSYDKKSDLPFKLNEPYKKESMTIAGALSWLESLRESLEEGAVPPPYRKSDREAAGMSALPTRGRKGPPSEPKVGGLRGKPPAMPHKVKAHADKLLKVGKTISTKIPEKKRKDLATKVAKSDLEKAGKADPHGTKGLGIKRKFTIGRARGAPPPSPGDEEGRLRSKMLQGAGKVVRKRADMGACKEGLELLAYKYRMLSERRR